MDRSLCERGGEVYRRKTSDYADRFFPYISLSPAACCIYVVYRRSSFVFFFFFLLFFYLLRDQWGERRRREGPWRCAASHPRRASAASRSPTERSQCCYFSLPGPPTHPHPRYISRREKKRRNNYYYVYIRWCKKKRKEYKKERKSTFFSSIFFLFCFFFRFWSQKRERRPLWCSRSTAIQKGEEGRSYRRKMARRDIFFHFLRGVDTHTHTRPHIKEGKNCGITNKLKLKRKKKEN